MIVDLTIPRSRIIVAEFLQDFGYQVVQASGGTEALDLLERTPDLRMMITDIRMPDMSGIELANLATRQRRDLKVILISGYFVSQTRRLAVPAQAVPHARPGGGGAG